jgi:hypothetical protein
MRLQLTWTTLLSLSCSCFGSNLGKKRLIIDSDLFSDVE